MASAPSSIVLLKQNLQSRVEGGYAGTFEAKDPDGGKLTYMVHDGRFEFIGNELKLKRGVDLGPDAPSQMALQISVLDETGYSLTKSFHFNVVRSALWSTYHDHVGHGSASEYVVHGTDGVAGGRTPPTSGTNGGAGVSAPSALGEAFFGGKVGTRYADQIHAYVESYGGRPSGGGLGGKGGDAGDPIHTVRGDLDTYAFQAAGHGGNGGNGEQGADGVTRLSSLGANLSQGGAVDRVTLTAFAEGGAGGWSGIGGSAGSSWAGVGDSRPMHGNFGQGIDAVRYTAQAGANGGHAGAGGDAGTASATIENISISASSASIVLTAEAFGQAAGFGNFGGWGGWGRTGGTGGAGGDGGDGADAISILRNIGITATGSLSLTLSATASPTSGGSGGQGGSAGAGRAIGSKGVTDTYGKAGDGGDGGDGGDAFATLDTVSIRGSSQSDQVTLNLSAGGGSGGAGGKGGGAGASGTGKILLDLPGVGLTELTHRMVAGIAGQDGERGLDGTGHALLRAVSVDLGAGDDTMKLAIRADELVTQEVRFAGGRGTDFLDLSDLRVGEGVRLDLAAGTLRVAEATIYVQDFERFNGTLYADTFIDRAGAQTYLLGKDDKIVFARKGGADVVDVSRADGDWTVSLVGHGRSLDSVGELLSRAVETADGIRIDLSAADSLSIVGASRDDISADHFLFG